MTPKPGHREPFLWLSSGLGSGVVSEMCGCENRGAGALATICYGEKSETTTRRQKPMERDGTESSRCRLNPASSSTCGSTSLGLLR